LGVLLAVSGCTGGPDNGDRDRLPDTAPPLAIGELEMFSGVATMNAGSNCTGTLVETGVDSGPAYILTNGHCVGDVGRARQRTTVDLEWFGTAEFFRVEGNVDSTHIVDVVAIEYSTMHGTDTAVVRLDATLGELRAQGVKPLPLAASEPASGTSVVNIGVPVQDLDWYDVVMRKGECTLDAQHTLIEFGWLWRDVWSNDCPGIIQGSSGSPLIEIGADGMPGAVVGVINTTSWGVTAADGGACFINRPCQVTVDAVSMVEETSYAQSVAGIGRCFSATSGEFDGGGDCPLPVTTVWADEGGGTFRGGGNGDASGRLPSAWIVGMESGDARTALVPLGDGNACLDPATYRDAEEISIPEAPEFWEHPGTEVDVDLPAQEGWFMLCAVAGDNYQGAASILFEVDRTPPLFPASATVEDIGDGAVVVIPHLNPPELANVRFMWGLADLDCSNTDLFGDFFTVPLTLSEYELPARYCVYGMDAAGNRTDVTVIDIPRP
jgi:hypothetical protein